MRVLYLNHTASVSGAEHTLLDLLGALPAEVAPIVVCPAGELADRVRGLGVAWRPLRGTSGSFRLHPVHTTLAVGAMAASGWRLRRLARTEKVDLIHANSVRSGLIAAVCRQLGGAPFLVHVHDRLEAGTVTDAILRLLDRTASGALTISRWVEEALEDRLRPRYLVHNPVDLEHFALADRDPTAEAVTIGVIAQITPWKGQREAMEAVALVRAKGVPARLAIIGSIKFDEPGTRYDNRAYLAALEARAREPDLAGSVDFLGERNDVAALLAGFDVVLVPSWGEPFGRAVIEAMASGVPVIATDIGGPAEIIQDGVTGVLVPAKDPVAMGGALKRVLDDAALRDRLRRSGREAASHYSTEAFVAKVLAAYAAST